jgi:hypothetical protein
MRLLTTREETTIMFGTPGLIRTARSLFVFALLVGASASGGPTGAAQEPPAPTTPEAPQNAAQARGEEQDEEAAGTDSSAEPKIREYRGVKIGMAADEARSRLGDKDARGKTSDFFAVSDREMAQVFYDADGKVRAISVIYTSRDGAPQAKDVLGEDVPPGGDGRVYKLVRYPQAGYWVAYSRTAGDVPVVTVTIQRMRTARP